MISVGIRELKNNLSRYLRRVKGGEDVVVTERGKPVARLTREEGAAESCLEEDLRRLETAGIITRATNPRRRKHTPPLKVPGKPLSEIVIEDRG